MNQEKIGKFIAEVRKEKKLTQEDLATKLGITKNAVSKWERGISMMDMSLLIPVCDILEVSITELLNGEKIEKESLKEQTENAIKNTLDYTDKKIKKSRVKHILCTVLIICFLVIGCFFGYKFYLLNKYTFKKPENVEELLKGIKNNREIKIYKRTIDEDEYFKVDNFKIRNDFKDYVLDDRNSEYEPYVYRNGKSTINFNSEKVNYQLIDVFTRDDVIFFGEDADCMQEKFTSTDGKFFLLKNDINNDVDFYLYASENYYKENNIFMDKKTMMENYAFNSICSIALPIVDELIIIKGDYNGYILRDYCEDKTITQVTITRDGKLYGFMTNDSRFNDEKYLIDIIGTIDIRN